MIALVRYCNGREVRLNLLWVARIDSDQPLAHNFSPGALKRARAYRQEGGGGGGWKVKRAVVELSLEIAYLCDIRSRVFV